MNKPEIIPQDDVAGPRARHKTTQVMVGNVAVGGGAPIVVQSMTNTDTADVDGTIAQVAALSRAGSEMVPRRLPPFRISATACASAASPRP
jgi:(E)-4-hydroxy-3-methylbut-2-enyl-diphosphate synthase